jgi:hypothetical protein
VLGRRCRILYVLLGGWHRRLLGELTRYDKHQQCGCQQCMVIT